MQAQRALAVMQLSGKQGVQLQPDRMSTGSIADLEATISSR